MNAQDLRTPLMRLRTRLEQARLEAQDEGARQKIDAAVAEAEQLLSTFNSLLRLARVEAINVPPPELITLDEVLGDGVEMSQAVAEARGQVIRTRIAPARVAGTATCSSRCSPTC